MQYHMLCVYTEALKSETFYMAFSLEVVMAVVVVFI